MSTESHNTGQEPRHTDVSFEERDIKVGTIYGYLFALSAAVVVSALICVYILRFTLNFAASTDTPPPPSREALGKDYRMMPPEPRLQGVPGHQTDPQADLRKKPICARRTRKTPRPMKNSIGLTGPPASPRFPSRMR